MDKIIAFITAGFIGFNAAKRETIRFSQIDSAEYEKIIFQRPENFLLKELYGSAFTVH